jgi:epoxide hydrolase
MQRFELTIDESDVTDLRDRLARTRWPAQLPGVADWSKGVPVEQARAWARDLADLDWKALQDEVNELPQWTTEIDGARIHFVHATSERDDAVPLLLLHGWPGTVLELVDLVGPLTSPPPGEPAFHVVIPSHPGTGLSGRTSEPGWGVPRTSRAYAALMAELGYPTYVVQGGDHGAVLAPHVARVDPEHVRGVHVNAASLGFMPMEPVDDPSDFTPLEQHRLEEIARFLRDGSAYNQIQSTRPQTIGYGLEDSPAALLTFIVEKVEAWTHDPARLADPHYRGRHLADVLVYWLTRTATSTADNVYASYGELFADPQTAFANSGVPTAVVVYAEDVSIRRFAERGNTIVRWTDVDHGGHFAALEQPEHLVADLRAFVRAL